MANWHVRALMERRNDYESDVYLKDFDIAMAVAIHIGEDDRPAVMSISKIAMMAGCHYNTADKRTKALAAAGKLVIGPGDGKLLAYSLPFEAVRSRHDERPPAQEPGNSRNSEIDTLRQEVAELRGIVETLIESVKQLHAAVTSSSHSHHTDVTSHQSDYVKEVEKRESREEERERARGGSSRTSGRKGRYSGPAWEMPPELDNDTFTAAWFRWVVHYGEKTGRALTSFQGELVISELANLGLDRAVKAIDHSIKKGWANIYEPDKPPAGATPPAKTNGHQPAYEPVGGVY